MTEPNKTPHFAFVEASTVRLDGKDKGLVIRLRGISESVLHHSLAIVIPSHEAEAFLQSVESKVSELELP